MSGAWEVEIVKSSPIVKGAGWACTVHVGLPGEARPRPRVRLVWLADGTLLAGTNDLPVGALEAAVSVASTTRIKLGVGEVVA